MLQQLDHERLEVYRLARELSTEDWRLRRKFRPGRRDIVDQLLRSTASIPLNIAEGSGESTSGRRAYFFRIARSSATETAAALDQLLQEADIAHAKSLIVRIVSMLVKLTEKITSPDSYPPLPPPRGARRLKGSLRRSKNSPD